MAKTYSLDEQLSVLSDEQLETLKQEMIKLRNRSAPSANYDEHMGGVGMAKEGGLAKIGRILLATGEGALLGTQGRPLSEGIFTNPNYHGMGWRPRTEEEAIQFEQAKDKIRANARESAFGMGWKPKTKEEAIQFEKEKAAVTAGARGSSISSFDIGTVPKIQNDEQRAEILASLPPDLAENVQAAGEYRLDATKLYGLRNNSGDRAKFDALINRIYPGWDMKKYTQRQKYITDLASGKLNQQVLAANTLTKHLDTFDQTIDNLKNTNSKPANAIINFAKDITGDPSITDFKFAKEIVNSEMQRLLTQVGVTQEGMNRVSAMLSNNAGFDQMKSNVQLLKTIMKGRLEPLRSQYKNIMGEEENGQIVFPDTRDLFLKAGQPTSSGFGQGNNSIPEGQTATNYKSGLKIIFRNGQWQPLR